MAGTDTSTWGAGVELIPGPQGEQGPVGPMPHLIIGTVVGGTNAAAAVTKESEDTYSISFTLPRGNPGVKGEPGSKGEQGDPGQDGLIAGVHSGVGIFVDNADPANPMVNIGEDLVSAIGSAIQSIQAGEGIEVDTSVTGTPTAPHLSMAEAYAPQYGTVHTDTVDPTTADIPEGQYLVWHNTQADECKLWVNLGGTLLSVELL